MERKNHRQLILLLLVPLFLFSACQSDRQETQAPATQAPAGTAGQGTAGYTDISIAQLQGMLANKDFTFVNVHTPFEGNIAGTDLSIPYDQIEQNLSQLPAGKDAKIVLYCRSGRMSEIAAKKLAGLGYTNVMNVEGGMVAWEQADLPIER